MRGMRNRMAHGYFDIDLNIVWDTVKSFLPELERQLLPLVSVIVRLAAAESLGDRVIKVDHAGEHGAVNIYCAPRRPAPATAPPRGGAVTKHRQRLGCGFADRSEPAC